MNDLSPAGLPHLDAMSANGCPCEDDIRQKWPLHWMVWNDDHKALDRILKCEQPVCELLLRNVSHLDLIFSVCLV